MKEVKKIYIAVSPHLEYNSEYALMITHQTHRTKEFGNMDYDKDFHSSLGNYIFTSSNGVLLKSVGSPFWSARESTLFVRGREKEYDESIVRVKIKEYEMIFVAIEEYNKYFSGGMDFILDERLFEI